MLLQLKPTRLPLPDGSIMADYFLTFQHFLKLNPSLKTLLHLDFNVFAIPQETLFLVNQYLYLFLSRATGGKSLAGLFTQIPHCVAHLLLWVLTVIAYSKTLNPMIFMTKEYFLQRVHEEEMFIV